MSLHICLLLWPMSPPPTVRSGREVEPAAGEEGQVRTDQGLEAFALSMTPTSSASLFPVGVTTGREPRRSRRTVITSGSSAAPIRTAATSLWPDALRSLSRTSSEQGEDDHTAEAPGPV